MRLKYELAASKAARTPQGLCALCVREDVKMSCFISDVLPACLPFAAWPPFFWPSPAHRALSPLPELSGAYWLPPGQRVSYPAYLAAQRKKRAAAQAQAQAAASGAASGAASAFLEACASAVRSLASAGGSAPRLGGSGSGHGDGGGDGSGDSDSGAARLRWLLGYTMGSPRAFENRRVEVALLLASDMAHGGGRLSRDGGPSSGGGGVGGGAEPVYEGSGSGGGGGGGGGGGRGGRGAAAKAGAETMTAERTSSGLWVDPLRLAVEAAREAVAEAAAEERGSNSRGSSKRISGDDCSRGDNGRLGGGGGGSSGDVRVTVTDGAVVASFRRSVAR